MGYTFTCNVCGTRYDRSPPWVGELTDTFIKTSDSPLTERFHPGQTITVCRECAEGLL